MRLASFVISFCLHAGFALLTLLWPSPPLHRPAPQAMTVSLVDGPPGAARTPSPILSPQSAPEQRQAPPAPAVPAPAQVAKPLPQTMPAPVEAALPPKLEPLRPASRPEPPPAPPPEALPADKKEETAKAPPTEAEDIQPEAKKRETPKPAPPKTDPVKAALDKARAGAKPPPGELKAKPDAVAQALAAARKLGGGGAGDGDSGGAVGDAYGAQIVMAVQPNWHWPAQAKSGLTVTLYLKIDAGGRVLNVRVEESSGNAAFDSSAVSAVRVTQVLPPPPSPAYREIVLNFFPAQ